MRRTIEPGPTPTAWDPEALLAKAQRYAEEMLAAEDGTVQHALMASLSLELLARAALANVSPVLLVEGKQAWTSVYQALGFPALENKAAQSIGTSEVLQRLLAIHGETFNSEVVGDCNKIAGYRNAELHSGETPFDGKQSADWQPQFYRACKILLATLGMELSEFVGPEEAEVAERQIAAKADAGAQAVRGDIAAHKRVWDGKDDSERSRERLAAALWARKQVGHRVSCPACGCRALVMGDPVTGPKIEVKDDFVVETRYHLPAQFECVACDLKINGLSKLTAANLGGRYKRTTTYDPAEYWAPDDSFPDFEDDNNEPF